MFHASNGWYFERQEDGSVKILKDLRVEELPIKHIPALIGITLDADTWCSVVASVSATGDDASTFFAAEATHNGTKEEK